MTSKENLATSGVNLIHAKLSVANYANSFSFQKTNLSVVLENITSSPDCRDVENRDDPTLAAFAVQTPPLRRAALCCKNKPRI
jgi:hypothetical protein